MSAFNAERVIGYFPTGGLFRGSTVYVTTDRIVVNKGRGQFDLRTHFLVALLVLVAPIVPTVVALSILLGVTAVIIFLLLRRRTLHRKWPTIDDVERGRREHSLKRAELLKIEITAPTRFGRGQMTIISTSTEPFNLKILGGKSFKMAKSLMLRFQASGTRMTD